MKKILTSLTIALILVSMLPILAPKASALEEAAQTQRTPVPPLSNENRLQIVMEENVTVEENGLSKMTLFINIPSSPLAEMYRKILGAPANASVEEVMPIPESILFQNSTEAMIPIRNEFHKSIEQQQLNSLGFEVSISQSSMMPKSSLNEFKVWLKADALLPIVSLTNVGSYDEWRVVIGSKDATTTTESVFTNLQLVQMMLESFAEKQEYECLWTTRIGLPADAMILNTGEISKLNWRIDFGADTYMTTTVYVQGTSTIVLEEKTVIAEEEITATSEYVCNALSEYGVFNVELLLPHSESTYSASQNATCVDDWSYDWTYTWTQSLKLPFEPVGPLTASLTSSVSFSLTGHIAWDFDWHGLKLFEAWMQLQASLGVKFEAIASASFSKEWPPISFFSWEQRYYFSVPVGPIPVPVWVDLQFTATGRITFNAFGKISITDEATASGSFKAGVRWTRGSGWEGIKEESLGATHTGPTITAEAGVSLRAGLNCRLSFLFYDISGPFIEFEPYATATASCNYVPPASPEGHWEISANLRVAAGATFAGWLKDLLGLKDWSTTLFDKPVCEPWSGTWEYSGTSSDETPPGAPGTPVANALLSTTGHITWTWTAASEDVGTVIQYHLQVGTSAGSSNIFDGYLGTDLSKTLYSLLGGYTYYARVRAKNAAGLWGPWSEVSEGVIVDRPPVTIISQGPSGMTCKDDVTFSWTGTDDVTPAANLLYSYYLEGYDSGWSSWTSTTTKGYTNLPTGNTYTFKVTAKDQRGTADPTPAERTFTIDPRPLEFANAIIVDENSFIDASIEGDIRAFHVFTSPVGFLSSTHGDTFLIMSTGIAANIPGNPEEFESTDFGALGPTDDTATFTLKLHVPEEASTLSFDFRFMSEEYPEWVGSAYNDFFYAYLTNSTGTYQIAYDDYGHIINVNNNFFNPNIYPIGTVFDGATKRLTTTVQVNPDEIIYLQFQVGDAGDGIYDTAVFLDNVRFNVGGGGGTTPTADVIVTKNAPNNVEQGKQFTYTINYFNIEEGIAKNVAVVDDLPSQVTFVSASSGGVYSSSIHSVAWNLGTMQPFSSGSLTLTVAIPSSTPIGTLLQNIVSITTTSQESNSNNNQYTKSTTVSGSSSLPPNVDVGPTVGNYNGIPVLYWTTPTTFTYHGNASVIGVDINIHLPDGGPDIGGPMTNVPGTYDWAFTYTFYPRHGQGTVTYTVHYADGHQSTTAHSILVDPSGYIYNAITGKRIQGATVTLLRFDTVLQQFVVVGPGDPGIEPHVNPQITDENGGYGWMVSPGIYMVRVEKEGYEMNFAIVTVPPPATDLNIPLTPIDITPPTTQIVKGQPHYVDPSGNTYVTSATSFTLTADDGPDGSGVAATYFRYYNVANPPPDWTDYSAPFNLTGLADGKYSIDFYSIDNVGNAEIPKTQEVTLDNTPPLLIIETPLQNAALQDGVTFTVSAWDLSAVASVQFSIQCAQGNVISAEFQQMSATLGLDGKWHLYFDTRRLPDGLYLFVANGTDVLGNWGTKTAPFSIRNWATIQLLPSTPSSKAGRTMPIKFSIRVKASVDPAQPFIYNEELTIKIYKIASPSNILLQTSTFGSGSTNYRIDTGTLYITNFKTQSTPATYLVNIYRKGMLIGSFEFKTVK